MAGKQDDVVDVEEEELQERPGQVLLPAPRQQQEAGLTLYGTRDPRAILLAASEQAAVLADVIEQQHLWSSMGTDRKLAGPHACSRGHARCSVQERGRCSERRHINIEGWTFLGTLLGVHAVVVDVQQVPDHEGVWQPPKVVTAWEEDPQTGRRRKNTKMEREGRGGWQATAEARTRDGSVIGRAVAEVRWEEPNWQDRDSYALLSMAQTRASGKVLRQSLDFVASLAGYTGTPAEELAQATPAVPPKLVPVDTSGSGEVVDMAGYLHAAQLRDDGNVVLNATKRLAWVLADKQAEAAQELWEQAVQDAAGDVDPEELDQEELLVQLVQALHTRSRS